MEQARIASPQGTQSAHAARGKPAALGKDSLADAQGAAAPGGFMALLAALGDGSAPEALVPQVTAQDALPAEPKDGDTQAMPQGGLLSWQWATALAGGAELAGQGVAGQGVAGQGVAGQGVIVGLVPVAIEQGLSAGALAPVVSSDAPFGEGSLLLQTALQDAAVPGDERGLVADIQGTGSAAGKRKQPGRQVGVGGAPAVDATSAPGAQGLGAVGAKGQPITAVQNAVFQPLIPERRDAGGGREGARPLEPGVDGVPTALAQLVSEAAGGGRILARGAESGATVSWAGGAAELSHDTSVGSGSEVGNAAVDPAMAGAEDAVAEQVAYWVHQNLQNARLTVKHDGQPVEVSVSLTGNEAHVAFGSDEVQTRELLDGSVAQLRDMLRQEGLVLSGVTVGESGRRQGDEGSGSENPKNAPKQAKIVVPVVEAQAAGLARVQGDRTVDIFV